jgi:hypothetical protein
MTEETPSQKKLRLVWVLMMAVAFLPIFILVQFQ